jgi:integrase
MPSAGSLDWIFSTAEGCLLNPTLVTKRFKHLVYEFGLPEIRLHDLRHTHASHLILAGANIKAVQERLGHADIVLTLNTYSHLLPTTQRDSLRALERFYSKRR